MIEIKKEKIKPITYLINRVQEREDQFNIPKFSFLLGAGCSATSKIPTGGGVIRILKVISFLQNHHKGYKILNTKDDFKKFLVDSENFVSQNEKDFKDYVSEKETFFETKITDELVESYKPENCSIPNSEIKEQLKWDFLYGNWFEEYSEDPRARQKLIEEIIELQELHGDYILFANLVQQGLIHNIFTTNFDDLINESLLTYVNVKARIYSHNELARYIKRPNVIKLHGDYLFENIKNISEETNSLELNMRLKFEEALNNLGLIVVGYGGADHSIMKVIESIKKDRPFTLLWVGRNAKKMHWRVVNLINNSKNTFFVEIPDFTTLMIKLWSINKKINDSLIKDAERKQQKLDAYLDQFSRTLEQNTNVPKKDKEAFNVSRKIEEIIRQYLDETDFDKRLEILDEGLILDPQNSNLLNNKGVVYNSNSQYEKALTFYNESIESNPSNPIPYINRAGTNYLFHGKYDEALDDIETAMGLTPNNSFAYSTKGQIYVKMGKVEEGMKFLNHALTLEPFNPNLYLQRGMAYGETSNYDKSIADYELALKYKIKDTSKVYNNFAVIYRRKEDFELAEKYIKMSLKEDPENANSYGTLALIYADLNDTENFYKNLEIALKKGCPVWFYLDDVSFNKFRSDERFTKLIELYKK